jgi:hypothetical protein
LTSEKQKDGDVIRVVDPIMVCVVGAEGCIFEKLLRALYIPFFSTKYRSLLMTRLRL